MELERLLTILGGSLGGLAALYTVVRLPRIENLRSRLRSAEARSSEVYVHFLDALKGTWQRTVDAHLALGKYVTPIRIATAAPIDEDGREAVEAFNDLFGYFEHQRILLPTDLSGQVDDLISKIRKILGEFNLLQDLHASGESDVRKWGDLWSETQDDLKELRREFEKAARAILDVDAMLSKEQ